MRQWYHLMENGEKVIGYTKSGVWLLMVLTMRFLRNATGGELVGCKSFVFTVGCHIRDITQEFLSSISGFPTIFAMLHARKKLLISESPFNLVYCEWVRRSEAQGHYNRSWTILMQV